MATISLTEALAEIATIDKRLPKKQEALLRFIARDERERDPMERNGGSVQYILSERQSMGDLNERRIVLRRAIAKANAETMLPIGDTTRSLADWLTWKREVYPKQQQLLKELVGKIEGARSEAKRRGLSVVTVETGTHTGNIVVNIDEQMLAQETERLEETFGRLDGALSLKNATTMITV